MYNWHFQENVHKGCIDLVNEDIYDSGYMVAFETDNNLFYAANSIWMEAVFQKNDYL